LPVGGIREKALAARRAGVKVFIMPRKNESDLQDIPKKLRDDLEFVLIDRVEQGLAVALVPQTAVKKRTSRPKSVLPAVPPPGVPPA
jgi:ATP-dependent Lon protease